MKKKKISTCAKWLQNLLLMNFRAGSMIRFLLFAAFCFSGITLYAQNT